MATQDPGSTTIKALTPDTWNLFAALVERHNGIFGGCWCVKFHPERADHVPGYDGNRAFKKFRVTAEVGLVRQRLGRHAGDVDAGAAVHLVRLLHHHHAAPGACRGLGRVTRPPCPSR